MQPYITYISYYKNNEYKDNMKKIQLYTILLAAPLLNGCGIYTRYARPDLDVCADSLYRTPVAEKDSGTVASKPWRELFTDPHLQALIATGLERNTDLGIARLQVEEAQAVLTNARLTLAQDRIGKIQAVVHLYHALGGGTDSSESSINE